MVAQATAFTAPNPDLFSGVFAVAPTKLRSASSLEAALRHTPDAFLPLGSSSWGRIKESRSVVSLGDGGFTPSDVAFVTFDHVELESAATLNKMLGIHSDGILRSLRAFDSKTVTYTKLSAAGLMPGVLHFHCRAQELAECVHTSGIPPANVVVKPSIGSGGFGLFRMPEATAVEDLLRGYSAMVGSTPNDVELVVMEYIGDGEKGVQEICIDGVRLGGTVQFLASHDKVLSDHLPPFRDKVIVSPSSTFRQDWLPLVERWLGELGAEDTVFHIEARVRGDEVIPIDFAARPGGGFISSMCAATTGVDLRLVHLYLMTGRSDLVSEVLRYSAPSHNASAIGAFYKQGRTKVDVSSLSNLEAKLSRNENVLGYHLSVQAGASGVLFPSASLSLCVGSVGRDEAIRMMQGIAADDGFESSAEFRS